MNKPHNTSKGRPGLGPRAVTRKRRSVHDNYSRIQQPPVNKAVEIYKRED